MRLTPTEEQALLASSADAFLRTEYDFAHRGRSLQAPHACASAVWQQFATMGWLGLAVPQDHGGSGLGLFESGLLMRAFGRHLVVEPYAAAALLAAPLLARHGRQVQRSTWLPRLLAGSRRAALAHEENIAPQPDTPRSTQARRVQGGWQLDGNKQLVPGAAGADLLLATARTGEGHRIFVLEPSMPGLHVTPVRTADGAWAADLHFDGLRLDGDAVLGEDADATTAITDAFARHIVTLCWEASGTMAALLTQTVVHVQQRVQFGRPLAEFQVVQHRLAEMAVACEDALASCELAALRTDAGGLDVAALAASAKAKVGHEARYVAQNAVQLHGAMGVTEELPVAAGFRRLMAFTQQHGSTTAHRHACGQALLQGLDGSRSRVLGALEEHG